MKKSPARRASSFDSFRAALSLTGAFCAAALAPMAITPASAAPAALPCACAKPAEASSFVLDPRFSVTASLGALDGQLAYGPGFQIEWPTDLQGNHFAFGAQTGFYYTAPSDTVGNVNISAKAWSIPVLATGKYFFDSNIDFLKPYLALGVGLSVDHESGNLDVNGMVIAVKDTTVHFAMLVRPGLSFGAQQKWFAEIPFGALLTDFAILPTVGYRF